MISSEKLFSEMIALIRENPPELICVAALTPDPIAPLRRLCKRLRDSFPELRLIACRWGQQEAGVGHQEQLIAAGADFSGTTLLETRNHLLGLFPVLVNARPDGNPAAASTFRAARASGGAVGRTSGVNLSRA